MMQVLHGGDRYFKTCLNCFISIIYIKWLCKTKEEHYNMMQVLHGGDRYFKTCLNCFISIIYI